MKLGNQNLCHEAYNVSINSYIFIRFHIYSGEGNHILNLFRIFHYFR